MTRDVPFLRVYARGGPTSHGAPSNLTLVIRGPGGSVRCNDDYSGDVLDPLVEGPFEVGDYEVYVGNRARVSIAPYDLVVTVQREIVPQAPLPYIASDRAEISGNLLVRSAVGIGLVPGQVCGVSGTSVGPPANGISRFVVRCGVRVIYDGFSSTSWSDWEDGVLARDLLTTSQDGSPAFEWRSAAAVLADDGSITGGQYRVDFDILPVSDRP